MCSILAFVISDLYKNNSSYMQYAYLICYILGIYQYIFMYMTMRWTKSLYSYIISRSHSNLRILWRSAHVWQFCSCVVGETKIVVNLLLGYGKNLSNIILFNNFKIKFILVSIKQFKKIQTSIVIKVSKTEFEKRWLKNVMYAVVEYVKLIKSLYIGKLFNV